MAKKQTKRALITSVISLLVCFSMLVGTTFAWFTDSVTSSGNIIKSGTLDVAMSYADAKADPASATFENAENKAIFKSDLWEPGYTEARHIKIENKGTLALKYQIRIVANGEVSDLADVIDVYYADPAQQVATRADAAGLTKLGTLTQVLANLNSAETTATGSLAATESVTITLALSMQTSAGNEYQNKSIGTDFSIQLIATQDTVENDSFGTDYDKDATYPFVATGSATVDGSSLSIDVFDVNRPTVKAGSLEIPADAVADDATEVVATFVETKTDAGSTSITDPVSQTSKAFELNVEGIKEGNTTPIDVKLYIGEGLTGVEVYHKGNPVTPITYNSGTNGYVWFQVTDFSPFEIVYDKVADPEELINNGKPAADLVAIPVDSITWSGWGGLNPNHPSQTLEVVYDFKAQDTSETIVNNAYKAWHVDFVVSVSADIEANTVALGGNYGGYGWVGFANPEAVDANVEIPLLQTFINLGKSEGETLAKTSGWTYESIVNQVNEFKCGVALAVDSEGNVVNTASDVDFIVKLRLTNPENVDEYFDVATVVHKLGTDGSGDSIDN